MNTEQANMPIQQSNREPHSIFLPVLLLAFAFLFWTGFQTMQLVREGAAMSSAYQNQDQLVQNATKMRKSLDTIAKETQKLADQGNPNAKLLIDELKKHGVNIKVSTETVPTQETP